MRLLCRVSCPHSGRSVSTLPPRRSTPHPAVSSSGSRLIAQATGGRYADAARLVAVGRATGERASFTGEARPPRHPHVAAALHAGVLAVAAAEVIRRFLDGVGPRADRAELDDAERFLVDRAPAVGVDGLARLVKQLEAHLDPDGVKPREDELRARRGLSVWEDAAGMINLKGAFDPATGAPIKLAIETLVKAELRRARDAKRPFGAAADECGGGEGVDPITAEERTIQQLNADALADIARLSLTATSAPPALRAVTIVARVNATDLAAGHGFATIDGIDQPVSIATLHELAASAGIAPMLIGDGHQVLEFGRSARLFSAAQKIALVERDGGCAWPGCTRPPSHADAHHIAWWKRDAGPTDLDNGVMLCAFHHHRVHDDGWLVVIRDHRSWFVPPVHLDPEQRPRPGDVGPGHPANRPPDPGRGRIGPEPLADAA
ncbi:DUF222 domain-containing protein [Agromyces sp. NPDC127015]|uniref:HNH endonuclease signature motif containing protein n=1 Tax=Agromyces sp. NPDC127015 TaxID=3347108 RepID=UPI00365E0344